MKRVTTIALLSKKDGMSARLFSRYWRDVHGVLAARIPGIDAYTQFHLGAGVRNLLLPAHVSRSGPVDRRFHGIAEVSFANEGARAGLVSSNVAALIQADEQNVFKTSLLYNLESGASRTYRDTQAITDGAGFAMLLGLRPGHSTSELIETLECWLIPALMENPGITGLNLHVLTSGDPSQWRTAGVDNLQTPATAFDAVLRIEGLNSDETLDIIKTACANGLPALFESVGKLHLYRIAARHAMVEGARPTHLGLRGLDALETITRAGADNQLQSVVTRCIYGVEMS
jgi:hypothetical protein